MQPWAEKFYKSKAWLKCRKAYIDSVCGICERCGKPGKIVHHKTYLNEKNINDPSVSLNFTNLEYLCQDCHNTEHMERENALVRGGLNFDEKGNLRRTPGKSERI